MEAWELTTNSALDESEGPLVSNRIAVLWEGVALDLDCRGIMDVEEKVFGSVQGHPDGLEFHPDGL